MKVLAIASVVELVDTPALGAGSERSAGSSPVRGTLSQNHENWIYVTESFVYIFRDETKCSSNIVC